MTGISTEGVEDESRIASVARMDGAAVDAILKGVCTGLRVVRLERDWRLATLATHWGVSQSVLCRLELARREPSLRQMIEAYGLLGLRFSDALRVAEDQAFPLGGAPWDDGRSAGLLELFW